MTALTVFVSVGTDHHRFDRLINAVSRWRDEQISTVRLIVQHGHSRPAIGADNSAMLERAPMLKWYAQADIVVTQVGPGTIADANAMGRRPIVLPRDPRRGEVVDDHQVAYGRHMHRHGLAWCARDVAHVLTLMSAAAADPNASRLSVPVPDPSGTAAAFSDFVDDVATVGHRRLSLRDVWSMFRSPHAAAAATPRHITAHTASASADLDRTGTAS